MKTVIAAAAAGALAALTIADGAAAAGLTFHAEDARTGVASGTYEYGASTAIQPTFPVFVTGRLTADFGPDCHAAYYTARVEDADPAWHPLTAGCGITGAEYTRTIAVAKKPRHTPGIKVCWARDGISGVSPRRNCGSVDRLTPPA
ncbi:hypothetical protein GCM10010124_30070 [Pilimelia terevasa]|uniref:Secreted protein n=1 Tax=Pilimelia terevasa TaxID=53372 RepID=A0A8J3BSW1_9ACTN|nr:hypothetical protein [Pilimelia terevasa]GGK35358.1 hypothetical protein GCM10010124_30070 [Pilimelia terevasa]